MDIVTLGGATCALCSGIEIKIPRNCTDFHPPIRVTRVRIYHTYRTQPVARRIDDQKATNVTIRSILSYERQ